MMSSPSPSPAALPRGYWAQSRSAACALWLCLPLLLAYEAAHLAAGPAAPRAAAEVWLREALRWLGFGSYWLLPALLLGGLASASAWRGEPWRPRPTVMLGVLVECVALAAALAVAPSLLWGRVELNLHAALAWTTAPMCDCGWAARMATLLGAAVYEETLFRGLLWPLLAVTLMRLGRSRRGSWLMAALVTCVMFAAAHAWSSPAISVCAPMAFRALAGAALSAIYWARGLAVAAGTHLAYDLLIGW